MEPNEYQTAAARTMAADTLDGRNHALCSWAMGLAGETAEFCVQVDALRLYATARRADGLAKVAAEFGDVLWYAAALCTHFELQLADVFGRLPGGVNVDPERLALLSVDHWKKIACHGHSVDTEAQVDRVAEIVGACLGYASRRGVSLAKELPQIMTANIEKLRRRFPDGFATERSVNREPEPVEPPAEPEPAAEVEPPADNDGE